MKTTLIFGALVSCAFSALCTAQSSGSTVNVSYDKFEDRTEVSSSESKVDDPVLRKKIKQDLRLHARYMCGGHTSHCRPDKLELMFVSYSTVEHIGSGLILIIDGKRIRASKSSWSTGDDGTGHIVEHIDVDITVEDFLHLARAQKVEGKLGQTTFKLDHDNLAGMRALADEIASSGGGK